MIKVITSSSRPLIGVLLSQSTEDLRYKAEISSRPLISIEAGADTDNSVVFSSPYRGSLISMYWCMSDEIGHEGSRPLIGVLLSQLEIKLLEEKGNQLVLVPLSGFSYLNTVPYTS